MAPKVGTIKTAPENRIRFPVEETFFSQQTTTVVWDIVVEREALLIVFTIISEFGTVHCWCIYVSNVRYASLFDRSLRVQDLQSNLKRWIFLKIRSRFHGLLTIGVKELKWIPVYAAGQERKFRQENSAGLPGCPVARFFRNGLSRSFPQSLHAAWSVASGWKTANVKIAGGSDMQSVFVLADEVTEPSPSLADAFNRGTRNQNLHSILCQAYRSSHQQIPQLRPELAAYALSRVTFSETVLIIRCARQQLQRL